MPTQSPMTSLQRSGTTFRGLTSRDSWVLLVALGIRLQGICGLWGWCTCKTAEHISPPNELRWQPKQKRKFGERPKGIGAPCFSRLEPNDTQARRSGADVRARKNMHNLANFFLVMTSDAKLTLAKARPK